MDDAGGAVELIERTFTISAAKVVREPEAVIAISRCTRSQRENRCISFVHGAARRRENRPLVQGAAKIEAATHRSRDKTDLGFFTFADAALLCACGRRFSAMRPKSRKRSLLGGFWGHIRTALSLRRA
ncbi:hypothetical protein VWY10_16455 [Phaeobacter sp. A86a-4a]